ncbi:MAG: type II toxin-antitoxin system prevent-host-death family antitoxin [Terrimicrobiaceae bacterium]|nr:type II toxin-antitoxin system prevent-host-death family antitoxin [Terrimicrobiaceae bacterium]
MAIQLGHLGSMTSMTIAELKDGLSEALARVESGEEITICRRTTPIAVIRALPKASTPRNWSEVKGWLDAKAADELEKAARRLRKSAPRKPF